MRRELLVVIAVLLLGSALAVTGAFSGAGPRIVGARVALPAGTRVTMGDVMSVERPPALPLEQAVRLERASSVIGATLVRDIEAGVPITLEDVGHASPPRTNANRPRRVGAQPLGERVRGASRRVRGLKRRCPRVG